ncbi:amidohydrolase [Paraburkholderia guartelaensis]|uniref:Amidohydrolase n=1 Tax=Paraburkholderia guartelaensis TaxID=2546446 RepID=A0A4R5L493_9BURK|nr:M20 aminoacylase family protein [Paraburkholderia guartelaensis]TDG03529.1 amidohydrolase [Paraburkholderia guartelaensis]
MNLNSDIVNFSPEIEAIRRDIHAHPELGYEVHRTAEIVATRLEEWGVSVTRGVGKTGIVGTLTRGASKRAIGLRADMDALPMQELNDFPHRSTHQGVMHACGHDGHTAMLLGAARYLARSADFDGTVRFIFQPAEEEGAGARAMIEDGLFERFPVDAVFGLHNWPGIPAGHFGVRPGPLMASASLFRIELQGAGCHGAMPHLGHDPVFAAAQIITSLQSIISRNKNPIHAAALSVTQVHSGDAQNVVPNEAWLGGTVRTFSDEMLDLIENRVREIASATASALGCVSSVKFVRNYPATVNDHEYTTLAMGVMRELVGEDAVDGAIPPTMASEDFSFMLRAKPGCYAFIGNGTGDHRSLGHGAGPCLLHNGSYDFNDALLPIGSSYFVRLVERLLARGS